MKINFHYNPKKSITITIYFHYNKKFNYDQNRFPLRSSTNQRKHLLRCKYIDIHYSQAKHLHSGVDEFGKLDCEWRDESIVSAYEFFFNWIKYVSASWIIWRVWAVLDRISFYNTKDKIFVRWRYCYSASFSLKLKLEANFQRRQSVKHLNWLYDESLYFM